MIYTDVYSQVLKYISAYCIFESLFDFVILKLKNTVLSGSNEAEKIVLITNFEN
jgi:hypothetical protein